MSGLFSGVQALANFSQVATARALQPYVFEANNRTFVPEPQDRAIELDGQSRVQAVAPQDRTVVIQ